MSTHNNYETQEHFWLVSFSIAWDVSALVISLICNLYGLVYVSSNRNKYPSGSILVMSIALSDIIVSAVVIPGNIITHLLTVPISPLLCKFCKYLSHWCTTIAGYCLAALCWDRFFVLSCNYDTFSKGRSMFYTSFVWFFGAAYNIWSVIIYTSWNMSDHGSLNDTYLKCVYNRQFDVLYDIVVICDLLVIYIFPLLIGFAACCVIFRYWNRFPLGSSPRNARSQPKKMYFLPICMILIYAACHVPAKIFEIFLYINSAKHLRYHEVYSLLEIVCFVQGFLIIPTYILTTDVNDSVVDTKTPSVDLLKDTDISSLIITELHTKLIPRMPTCSET